MSSKPGKKTKAQIEAEKAAAEAAAEAERRAAEERAESDRRKAAEEAEAARLKAEQLRGEELERLAVEHEAWAPVLETHARSLSSYTSSRAAQDDWRRYAACTRELDARKESALNTFMTEISDREAVERAAVMCGTGSLLASAGDVAASTRGAGGAAAYAGYNAMMRSGSIGGADAQFPPRGVGMAPPGSASGFSNNAYLPPSVGAGIRLPFGFAASVPHVSLRVPGEMTPLSPTMATCTRIVNVGEDVERVMARAVQAMDVEGVARARSVLLKLRDMIATRIDVVSSQLLDAASEYAVELKDGVRELQVCDTFSLLTPEFNPLQPYVRDDTPPAPSSGLHEVVPELYADFRQAAVAGEVVLWANLGPAKVARTKTVRNTPMRDKSAGMDAMATIAVDLHKQVASLHAALRVVRTAFDHAAGAADLIAAQEAHIAAASGMKPDEDMDDVTAMARARTSRGATGRSSSARGLRGSSAQRKSRMSRAESKTEPEGEDGTSRSESKLGDDGKDDAGEGKEGDDDGEEDAEDADEAAHKRTGRARPQSHTTRTNGEEGDGSSDKGLDLSLALRSLGGVTHIELLALPPPPIVVKGWGMTRMTPALSPPFTVKRLPHPAIGQGTSAMSAQALKVKLRVPDHVIVPDVPAVARWMRTQPKATPSPSTIALTAASSHFPVSLDLPAGRWVQEDVNEVAYDKASRMLSFSSVHLAAYALVTPRYVDLPYSHWMLCPVRYMSDVDGGETLHAGAVLRIATRRFTVSILVLEDGMCRVVGPDVPELRWLVGSSPITGEGATVVPPGEILALLYRSGVHLQPLEADATFFNVDRELAIRRAAAEATVESARDAAPAAVVSPTSDADGQRRVGFESPKASDSSSREDAAAGPSADGEAKTSDRSSPPNGGMSESRPRATSHTAPSIPFPPLPLSLKDSDLEWRVYEDMAHNAGAFAAASSKWNAHPATPGGSVIARMREVLYSPLAAAPPLAQVVGVEADTDATAWRVMHFQSDPEAACRMHVSVVNDTEPAAAHAWSVAVAAAVEAAQASATPPPAAPPAADTPATSDAAGAPSAVQVVPPAGGDVPAPAAVSVAAAPPAPHVPAFQGGRDVGVLSHSCARHALQPRASLEAMQALERVSPAFIAGVHALLCLVRPLSFTQ